MAIVIDDNDPCGAAEALRALYLTLVAGSAAETVTFRAGASGVERSVVYHKADPGRLLSLIRGLEMRCSQMHGRHPRRYALRAGGA